MSCFLCILDTINQHLNVSVTMDSGNYWISLNPTTDASTSLRLQTRRKIDRGLKHRSCTSYLRLVPQSFLDHWDQGRPKSNAAVPIVVRLCYQGAAKNKHQKSKALDHWLQQQTELRIGVALECALWSHWHPSKHLSAAKMQHILPIKHRRFMILTWTDMICVRFTPKQTQI